MNEEDQNNRNELEARVAADVLGESSDLERDRLRELVEDHSELAAKKKEFERVNDLLRDVAQAEFDVDDEEWKLPRKRRDAVMATLSSKGTETTGGASTVGLFRQMLPIPQHAFWSAKRITAVVSVAVLGGVMAMTTYSFLRSNARLGMSYMTSDRMTTELGQMPDAVNDMEAWYGETDSPASDFGFAEMAEVEEEASASFTRSARPSEPKIAAGFKPEENSKSALSSIRDSLAAAPQDAASIPSSSSPSGSLYSQSPSTDLYFRREQMGDVPAMPQVEMPMAMTATAEAPAEGMQMRGLNDQLFETELSSPSSASPSVADSENASRSDQFDASNTLDFAVTGTAENESVTKWSADLKSLAKNQQGATSPNDWSELSASAGGYAGGQDFAETRNGSVRGSLEKGLEEMVAEGEPSAAPDLRALALGIPRSGPNQEQGQAGGESDLSLRGGTTFQYSIDPTDSRNFAQGITLDDGLNANDADGDANGRADRMMFGGAVNGDVNLSADGAMLLNGFAQSGVSDQTSESRGRQNAESERIPAVPDQAKSDMVRAAEKEVVGKDMAAKQVARNSPQPMSSLEGFEKKTPRSKRRYTRNDIAPPAALNETIARENAFSTFSLHVSDVSFKLALAALQGGTWPEAAKVRIEEFVNAFDYGDPMPRQDEKVACQIEQSIHPFLQQRNLLRVSLRTAAAGRAASTPLRLTFLLDNSGSMERYDRRQTVRRAFALLAQQLNPTDQVTLISFARQPRLLADKVSGSKSQQLTALIDDLPSEGGTNLESALKLAFEKASEQQSDGAQNRIVLLTDGAVNLGDANPDRLSNLITTIRDADIAFDAAGICAEGLNDEVLEALTRNGDGRYYLLDSPESADDGFVRQIAGALRPSAKNVKVQIEFNPDRVGRYKLLGFEKHLLKKEDFRNDQVDAAEMAAAEAGVAVYQVETKPDGDGDIGSVSVRFRDLSSGLMVENRWPIRYQPDPPRPDQSTPALRIATSAALFAAKLRGDPLGEAVDLKTLSELISGLPERNRNQKRVRQLHQMIEQARQISGN